MLNREALSRPFKALAERYDAGKLTPDEFFDELVTIHRRRFR